MFVAPLEEWRRAEVTEQRRRKEWAEQVKILVDENFPRVCSHYENMIYSSYEIIPGTAEKNYQPLS
jgi:hypothetical protein